MSGMIERIAVWFCRQRGLDPGKPVWTGPIHGPRQAVPTWTRFAEEARDLIAQMREPTEAMIEAGDDLIPIARGTETHRMMGGVVPEEIWRAMIDRALDPPSSPTRPPQ